ncbi:MAG: glycosyltransferase [Rhizobiaceae bacterium]|nr:glycosyltransferase [Rhizobiaceae bacterium]
MPTTRKTSVHFISRGLADDGHEVKTISVGYSYLTRFKKKQLYLELAAQQKNRFVTTAPRYESAAYLPLLHPFSSGQTAVNAAMAPFFALYGSLIPGFMSEAIREAEVVLIESGTAIVFFNAIRRINPNAKIIYFARDRLDTVGASKYLQRLERATIPLFDRIVVPSSAMASTLRDARGVDVIPQGVDKTGFDAATVSPYPEGSVNAITVGNMLFDKAAVSAMARAAPTVKFHLFGSGIPNDFPENVRLYGERPFADVIPYIKFADFGIAPYRLTQREFYLAESSLKLLQYSYCSLPILAPDMLKEIRENIVGYSQTSERDWAGKVTGAATMRHDDEWKNGILTWAEVSSRLEQAVAR